MLEILFIAGGKGIQIDYIRQANTPAIEHTRWINVVTHDPWEDPLGNGTHSFIDPVMCSEWKIQPLTDCSKYYWDDEDFNGRSRYKVNHPSNRIGTNVFRFQDIPHDTRLKENKPIKFRTCLVDVTNNDKELACVSWNLAGKNSKSAQVVIKGIEPITMQVKLPPLN